MQLNDDLNDERAEISGSAIDPPDSMSPASPHAALGAVVELMSHSAFHRNYTALDIMRVIAPPIALGQCCIFRHKGVPFGFISWANLNEEAEAGYVDGTRKLQPNDWDAGDRFWLIDVLFPKGGRREARGPFLDLTADKVGKMLRIKEDGTRKIYNWYGKNHRASPNAWWRSK